MRPIHLAWSRCQRAHYNTNSGDDDEEVLAAPKVTLPKKAHIRDSRQAPVATTAVPIPIPISKLKPSGHRISKSHDGNKVSDLDQDYDGGSIISCSAPLTNKKRSIKTFLKPTTTRRISSNRHPSLTKQNGFHNPYSNNNTAKEPEVDVFTEEPIFDPSLQPSSPQNFEPTPLPFIPAPIKGIPAHRRRSIVHPRAIICYAITEFWLKLNLKVEGHLSERLHRINTLRHLSDANIDFCELKEHYVNKELPSIEYKLDVLYSKVACNRSIETRRRDLRTRGPSQLRHSWTPMDFKEHQGETSMIRKGNSGAFQPVDCSQSHAEEVLVIVPRHKEGERRNVANIVTSNQASSHVSQRADQSEQAKTWTAIKAYGSARSIDIKRRDGACEVRRHSLPLMADQPVKSTEEGSLENCLHALRLGDDLEQVATRIVRRHTK